MKINKKAFITAFASGSILFSIFVPQSMAHSTAIDTGDAASSISITNVANKNVVSISGNDNSEQYENNASYNTKDREYLEMILSHHNEAIAMANLELSRGSNTEVKGIAEKNKMEQMMGLEKGKNLYRKVFNAEPPIGMTMTVLPELQNSQNVDEAFLRLMAKHHLDGIMMAKEELEEGKNPEVKQFALEDIQMQWKDIQELYMLHQQLF